MDAVEFGPIAPQRDPEPGAPGYGIMLELFGPSRSLPQAEVESEDCQVLNIWTSSVSPDIPRPVIVWLHPGGFMMGSGESGDGATLAGRGDIVVVSINHRLNVFGYCHLDDLSGDFIHSGNLGQLDIVAALRWIQENIVAFGGDPNRVTVLGASAGGAKMAWLLASPRGQGLVARAGSQSGPCLRLAERDDASEAAVELLAELGLRRSEAGQLRTLEAPRLLWAFHRLRLRKRFAGFAPVIDAAIVPRHPFDPDAAPGARDIPLLLGWNREDMAFFQAGDLGVLDLDASALVARVKALVGDRANALIETYRQADPSVSAGTLYLRILSDCRIGRDVLVQAERKSDAGGAPTYVYRFDHPSPVLGGKLGALHSSETDYVFGQDGPFLDRSVRAARLGAAMRDAWVQFAATGDPNAAAAELPHWQPFGEGRKVMRLSHQPGLMADPIPAGLRA